jgi:hypothetical protein
MTRDDPASYANYRGLLALVIILAFAMRGKSRHAKIVLK